MPYKIPHRGIFFTQTTSPLLAEIEFPYTKVIKYPHKCHNLQK